MNAPVSDQLDLLGAVAGRSGSREGGFLGVGLDQRAVLQFLSEEWLHPQGSSYLVLGSRDVCAVDDRGEATVAIWFDLRKLPTVPVLACRQSTWREIALDDIGSDDALVAWSGPLPLFAVARFEVRSKAAVAHLLALARNFADMDVPKQSVTVAEFNCISPPRGLPADSTPQTPPENWDAFRGAAAMAAYAVPAIDPWIDLFCQVLRGDEKAGETAENLHAPWWKVALWSRGMTQQEDLSPLWRAMVDEFASRGRLREWKAKVVLEAICEKALLLGEPKERIERLRSGATALLNDQGTVEEVAELSDNLALTLQLLLLRPSPERFLEWREDWQAIPPVVWWTGMTLAGYLQGYRSLPKQFRGTPESQRLLALNTWQLASVTGAGPWSAVMPQQVHWTCGHESVVLLADGATWAEHKLGTRGHWHRANFDDRATYAEAESIAQHECPQAILKIVALTDTSIPFSGEGRFKVDAKLRKLNVNGRVELALGSGVAVESKLDINRFRIWLATASITQRIRRPSVETRKVMLKTSDVDELVPRLRTKKVSFSNELLLVSTKTAARKKQSIEVAAPSGLKLLEDFISPVEEEVLIATIDSLEWNDSMKRRVQHYGWRYDYKARKVDPTNYLGPLPVWAQDLAARLLHARVVSELPDQVIVNNYDGKQGISKHIDCPGCFRGPVTTISLLETWDMIFTRRLQDGTTDRFVQPLLRRSAAVLSGEARSAWAHEIPERLTEHGVPRGRRVSVTFRKVAT